MLWAMPEGRRRKGLTDAYIAVPPMVTAVQRMKGVTRLVVMGEFEQVVLVYTDHVTFPPAPTVTEGDTP